MFADPAPSIVSPMWGVIQSAIAAGSGLLGVFAGSWMTARSQSKDRRKAQLKEQLQDFYSPMIGMRAEVTAKRKTSEKLSGMADTIWKGKDFKEADASTRKQILIAASPTFSKLFHYDNEQFAKEILPLYKKMLRHFSDHMWLAEQSTQNLYELLVEFVEVSNRFDKDTFEVEMLLDLDTSQEILDPLFADIEHHFVRLRSLLIK